MNLLPKKSWHVRTRKNIERVQRDQAEAQRLEGLELERRLRVEQELRLRELRHRAGLADEEQAPDTHRPPGRAEHFNLFEGLEQQQTAASNTTGHAQRRRPPDGANCQKRLVRAADVSQPWYCDTSRRPGRRERPPSAGLKSGAANEEPDGRRQRPGPSMSIYDPMTAMRHAERIHRERKAERRAREAAHSRGAK